ncbi:MULTISPECIES: IS200/IS605 family transposase [Bacillaceae]|uniref:Transposase IS200-like domain-containing protein n=2 Tax=Anoxybacillaceae TaxID=3120669 RepID=A0A150MJJ1_9BACL|nr:MULTISPECIES: IS200/IS605 family transposase [Bacillaceae]KYD24704.1 hypothetical protein B4110_3820 [Parageobacillus toebii]MED4990700.1 IS200/IS605 family transposase [Parageobacillus toebii]
MVYLHPYHVIFYPKYRRKVLVGEMEKDLRKIFYQVVKEKDVEIQSLEIMPDHVHWFISL